MAAVRPPGSDDHRGRKPAGHEFARERVSRLAVDVDADQVGSAQTQDGIALAATPEEQRGAMPRIDEPVRMLLPVLRHLRVVALDSDRPADRQSQGSVGATVEFEVTPPLDAHAASSQRRVSIAAYASISSSVRS